MAVIRWKRTGASPSGTRPLLFIGGVCLFIATLFCAIGGTLFLTERRYSQQGVRALAVVTDKSLRPATDDSSTVYEIDYEFTVPDGARQAKTEGVDVHVWEAAEAGAPLDIEYVAGDPSSARVPPSNTEEAILAGIMLGAGLVLGAIGPGTNRRRRVRAIAAAARLRSRLRERGMRTDGIVVAIEPRNVRINDVRQWRLRYAYQAHQGGRHERSVDLPELHAREWRVGAAGRVLYGMSDPATAVWVGREE